MYFISFIVINIISIRYITFINPSDQRKFKKIEDLIGSEIKKNPLPESFGATPEYNPEKQEVKPGFKSFRKGKKSFKGRSFTIYNFP